MINAPEDFYKEAQAYAMRFDDFAAHQHRLQGHIVPDHICYKCGATESFEKELALLTENGVNTLRDMSIISGRRIAYVELTRWVDTLMGPIHYLELQEQKPDGSQKEGFAHIEAYPVDMNYDALIEMLRQGGEEVTEKVRPHHTTHEVNLGGDFFFVCTREPLIDKIEREKKAKAGGGQ
jgi:predicted metalloenzyme YecM